jgi:hypothetical protein
MATYGIMKKMSLYSLYKKTINENSAELLNRYNLRIDSAHRMYTVLNIPEDIIGEAYSLRKADIDRIADKYLREFSSDLATMLNDKGLPELYDFYEVKKVDKYSYLVVIGFSLFRTDERRGRLFKIWIPIGISLLVFGALSLLLL